MILFEHDDSLKITYIIVKDLCLLMNACFCVAFAESWIFQQRLLCSTNHVSSTILGLVETVWVVKDAVCFLWGKYS